MTLADDRPTIAERFATAINATNLRLETERRGAVDLFIASGWARSDVGRMLTALRAEFDSVKAQIAGVGNNARTDHALILMRLTTLAEAKAVLGRLAVKQATIVRFMAPDDEALRIAGRCLDVFLNPKCYACGGRGFTGGGRLENSGPRIRCKHCRETGNRQVQIGRNDEQHRFAGHLLWLMESAVTHHEFELLDRLR